MLAAMHPAVVLASITSLKPLVSTPLISLCSACEGAPSPGHAEEPKLPTMAFIVHLAAQKSPDSKQQCSQITTPQPTAVFFSAGSLFHVSRHLSVVSLAMKLAGFCVGGEIPTTAPRHHRLDHLDGSALPLSSHTFSTV